MICQILANQIDCCFEYDISVTMPAPSVGDVVSASDSDTGKKFTGTVIRKQFVFLTGTIVINLGDVWEL